MKTFTPKPADLTHDWYIIDATDVVLGRLATQVATLLRGKNKPTYAPHADSGNHVIIINADKIALTGNKMGKELYSHSGRPGGLRRDSYAELLANKPERIIKAAVKGMLPKNRLSKVQLDRLRIFRGAEHPHTPQQPQVSRSLRSRSRPSEPKGDRESWLKTPTTPRFRQPKRSSPATPPRPTRVPAPALPRLLRLRHRPPQGSRRPRASGSRHRQVDINKRTLEEYFPSKLLQREVNSPDRAAQARRQVRRDRPR